ncbi:hypothetical protein SAMN04489859_10672 [Paracoccus alcaliphilus]|uniref:Uncharacterized protein n=1 Tax=Paracoccus alcaliphilus TaxID=34002 RepID=A0A1H8NPH0_9RHOB|nr:hypothetical protein [Paracoccus alcaliphilus]WCR19669.1 hypothetical protein JHW40_08505 [Paracoccus alcaliphilus]SEO31534.1 hypothetical protein SAMN04489859_10672 [Paracoccus alcaliphilus]
MVELMVEGTVITMRGDGNDIVHDLNDYPEMDPEGLDNLSTVALIGDNYDVRFAFVAYAQEIPDEGGRAAMRAEAQAAIARAEA